VASGHLGEVRLNATAPEAADEVPRVIALIGSGGR
jgi:hypothetical protein